MSVEEIIQASVERAVDTQIPRIIEAVAKAMQPPEPTYITVKEAQQRMAIGRTKLYSLIREGELRRFNIDSTIRISRAEVEEWMRMRGRRGREVKRESISEG